MPRLFPPAAMLGVLAVITPAIAAVPVPDKLVVLTFDDSSASHYTVAAPLLRNYGFGATFFITEGFTFRTNKKDYMTWEQIAELHRWGFEIGNHTRDHLSITEKNVSRIEEQLTAINERCREHGIPTPMSFAWPGNRFHVDALPVLQRAGIRFARRGGEPEVPYAQGGGVAFEPGDDHPLLIPTAGDARPDWTLESLQRAVAMARDGRVAVLQFHGVPDGEHPWVNTPRQHFEEYMAWLHRENFTVIALRDLGKYLDGKTAPPNPLQAIERRQRATPQKRTAAPPAAAPPSTPVNGVRRPGGAPEQFQVKSYAAKNGQTLAYSLFVPARTAPEGNFPLVLCLHGAGGNTDAAKVLVAPERQARHPCVIVAPACDPASARWVDLPFSPSSHRSVMPELLECLDHLARTLPVDRSRIYVTGQSMGGFGTWGLLAAEPQRFAAAVPVCGGWQQRDAARMRAVPIWAFHGEQDQTVPVEASRRMIAALNAAGASPRYTEYAGVGHNSWTRAYGSDELWEWLFAQRRSAR